MAKMIYEYNTDHIDISLEGKGLYEIREDVVCAASQMREEETEVTILIQGYNELEKIQQCIESVLKYSSNVNFDLILVDNGSSDGTFEYFQTIEYDKVKIVRISKNISSPFPWNFIKLEWLAPFFVTVNSDLIVTQNWLSNLLTVAKSDPKIGMVNPMSSNTTNYQCHNINFTDFEDMQKKAAEFNKQSNPAKWHEKLRLITLGTLYRKECIYAIGMPLYDPGFIHNFGDDDITFRVRRAGYKAILAMDTWIHHNHNYKISDKDKFEAFKQSLYIGKEMFKDKYLGIDAWNDVNNPAIKFYPAIKSCGGDSAKILGIDTKCGAPILEIKNIIKEFGIMNAETYAFTQQAKYFMDLQTICGVDNVICENPENIRRFFEPEMFDYIFIDKSINSYSEPLKMVKDVATLLKPNGQLFVYLKNTYDIYVLLKILGHTPDYDCQYGVNYSIDDFGKILEKMNLKVEVAGLDGHNNSIVSESVFQEIKECVSPIINDDIELTLTKLKIDRYALKITKR